MLETPDRSLSLEIEEGGPTGCYMAKKTQSAQTRLNQNHAPQELSAITRSFIENLAFLKSFLRRFMRRQQDIDDVVQEAYLKAYSAEKSKPIEHPKSYLFTIARNIAINELTSKTHKITDYIEECKPDPVAQASFTLESELEGQQALGVYCDAVEALPAKCRRVFILRRVHGMKQAEIAESLGISLRTVEKHLHQGTLKCRTFIQQQQKETVGAPEQSLNSLAREDRER